MQLKEHNACWAGQQSGAFRSPTHQEVDGEHSATPSPKDILLLTTLFSINLPICSGDSVFEITLQVFSLLENPTSFLTAQTLFVPQGRQGTVIHCWQEYEMVQPLWKIDWWFHRQLNILLPYNPTITLLGIYPRDMKIYVHTKPCTRMFIAALFIIAKTWKQSRCPSLGEWINNLWQIFFLYRCRRIY